MDFSRLGRGKVDAGRNEKVYRRALRGGIDGDDSGGAGVVVGVGVSDVFLVDVLLDLIFE